jgi:N-acetylglucosamine-6-phosphate deacetylase
VRRIEGQVLTPQGYFLGAIELTDDGRIAAIPGTPVEAAAVRESKLPIVLPGFIDLHVHGGGGRDVMEGGDTARRVSELHANHGTTALLATTTTAPSPALDRAFAGLAPLCSERAPRGARILGVHLEGLLAMDELRRLHAVAPIRLITLSAETRGHMEAIASLCGAGFKVQLGHGLASYEEGTDALSRGASGFTNLFNAMTLMHHRAPGLAGAALAHAENAEIIPDLLHVHPGAIRVALHAIPKLHCVTDSTSAAGMPGRENRIGRNTVTECLGGVRLADGTLAGSTLTMDQALRNLVDTLGLDLADAARRVSTHAADYVGLADRGRLAPGAWGDAVVLDRDLKVREVFVEGVQLC